MALRSKEILHELSGGKDSSFSLSLLKSEGLSVVCVFLRLFGGSGQEERARAVARRMESELKVLDLKDAFREKVVNYFIKEYESGRTPNPCTMCNREIKFGKEVMDLMYDMGISRLSTGHYAISEEGKLFEGTDRKISQAYFLSMVRKESMAHTTFPMGRVRRGEAASWFERTFGKTPTPTKDICFLTEKNYRSFLDRVLGDLSGPIYDTSGKLIGHHKGIHHYTVGQRKMLPGGFKKRMYVVRIDPEERAVYVGDEDEAKMNFSEVRGISWIKEPEKRGFEADVRVRYRATPKEAEIYLHDGGATIHFKTPEMAPAPGQTLVINMGEEVLGGGPIERSWQ